MYVKRRATRRGPVRDGLGRVPDLARGTLPRPQPSGRRADRPLRVRRSREVFVPVSGVRADATRIPTTPRRETRSHVALPGRVESRSEYPCADARPTTADRATAAITWSTASHLPEN